MKNNILKPNYNKSILSISSSILKNYGLNSNYKSLEQLDNVLKNGYKNVVFIILDCLGENIFKKHCASDGFFRKNLLTTVTSVFPPTTPAATTAFHSGKSPLENGWMPYFSDYGCMVELFSGKDYYNRNKVIDISNSNISYESIYSIIENNSEGVTYHKVFPSFTLEDSFSNICNGILDASKTSGKNIISAYWTEPVHTIHNFGVNSNEVGEVIRDIENNIEILSNKLENSIIIISADHGAVDVDEIYINEIDEINNCLLMPPSIESRFVSFFVKKGKEKDFENAIKKNLKAGYLLYKKDEFLSEKLLGNGIEHDRIKNYIGDYVIICYNNLNIRYSVTGERGKKHLADHGGITKDEMLVPVIVIKKN